MSSILISKSIEIDKKYFRLYIDHKIGIQTCSEGRAVFTLTFMYRYDYGSASKFIGYDYYFLRITYIGIH